MESEVTVLMPVYNGQKYLKESIESILNQTFREFVFVIVNDGSTDSSEDIINQYTPRDSRIKYYSQTNKGLTSTLNKYFGCTKSKFLVRMDCDDIAFPTRLERQINYLKKNPDIGIIGSFVKEIDQNGKIEEAEILFPRSHHFICWKMLYTSGFCHPATVIRKEIFDQLGGYNPEAWHVEDYEFFLRARQITRMDNIPEALLLYRKHGESVSDRFSNLQRESHFQMSKSAIGSLQLNAFSDDCVSFLKYSTLSNLNERKLIFEFLMELFNTFVNKYSPSETERQLIKRDVAIKLSTLAFTVRKKHPLQFLKFYVRAAFFYPPLILHTLKIG